MTLKGNIRDFPLTQLLNLINLAKKTGTLVLEDTTESASLSFRDGKLAYARMDQEDNSLATILYQAKKINPNQHQVIRARSSSMSDKELGLLLINANYLSQQDVINSLQAHFVSIIQRLFTWMDGFFRFEKDIQPPEDKITLRIGLENLIFEGVRRTREWEQLQDEIPSLDMAMKFCERPGSNVRDLSLSKEEWKVISYVNPKNSIQQIGRAVQMNDVEIRRIVYALLQAGIVELVRPLGAPVVTRPVTPTMPAVTKEQRKSLIGRLIDRIRSL